jgi:putative membrane protein
VGVVFLIRWLIQAAGGGKASGQRGSGAVEILKERYARGEINKAEFESMKRDMS